jgi:hypothetical protein
MSMEKKLQTLIKYPLQCMFNKQFFTYVRDFYSNETYDESIFSDVRIGIKDFLSDFTDSNFTPEVY